MVFSDHEDAQSGGEESCDSQSSSNTSSSDDGVVADHVAPPVALPDEVVVGDYTITTDIHHSQVSRAQDHQRYIIKCLRHANCVTKTWDGSRTDGNLR